MADPALTAPEFEYALGSGAGLFFRCPHRCYLNATGDAGADNGESTAAFTPPRANAAPAPPADEFSPPYGRGGENGSGGDHARPGFTIRHARPGGRRPGPRPSQDDRSRRGAPRHVRPDPAAAGQPAGQRGLGRDGDGREDLATDGPGPQGDRRLATPDRRRGEEHGTHRGDAEAAENRNSRGGGTATATTTTTKDTSPARFAAAGAREAVKGVTGKPQASNSGRGAREDASSTPTLTPTKSAPAPWRPPAGLHLCGDTVFDPSGRPPRPAPTTPPTEKPAVAVAASLPAAVVAGRRLVPSYQSPPVVFARAGGGDGQRGDDDADDDAPDARGSLLPETPTRCLLSPEAARLVGITLNLLALAAAATGNPQP